MRLNKLVELASPVDPPAQAWREIEQRLFADAAPRAGWAGSFKQIAFWRNLTLGSSLLAMAVILLIDSTQQTRDLPGFVVLIQNDNQQAVWTARTTDTGGQDLVRNHKPTEMPEDTACLLWVQPKGSAEFVQVGFLPDNGALAKLSVNESVRQHMPTGRLFVTMEKKSAVPQAPSSAFNSPVM